MSAGQPDPLRWSERPLGFLTGFSLIPGRRSYFILSPHGFNKQVFPILINRLNRTDNSDIGDKLPFLPAQNPVKSVRPSLLLIFGMHDLPLIQVDDSPVSFLVMTRAVVKPLRQFI